MLLVTAVCAAVMLVLTAVENAVSSVDAPVDIPVMAEFTDSCRPDIAVVVDVLAPSQLELKDSVMDEDRSEMLVSMVAVPFATSVAIAVMVEVLAFAAAVVALDRLLSMPFVMLEVIAWPEARAAASTSGIPAVTVVFRDEVACVASPWIAVLSSPDPAVRPLAMVPVSVSADRRAAVSICGRLAMRP